MTFGKRVGHDGVAASGLSQRQVAAHMDLDETKLSKSLAGRRWFSADELLGLATTTGVTAKWLLGEQSTVSATPPAPRMAPASGEAEVRRRMIVEAAWSLFARTGFDAVRIADVAEEWIDYNGHMSEPFYVMVFGFTTDRLMIDLGMDGAYREQSNCSLYTVEAHVRYLQEVPLGSTLQVVPHVVSSGPKKLHLGYEMYVDGTLVATEEIMTLHVDQQQSGAVPFPPTIAERIAAVSTSRPDWTGRSIA